VTENARVLAARAALLESDLRTFGRLLDESHASLRDDYEVSAPLVDLLVSLAQSHARVYGARMTGGGFGGAIVAAVQAGSGHDVAAAVSRDYEQRSGRHAAILVPLARGALNRTA
jgi:galactokinase